MVVNVNVTTENDRVIVTLSGRVDGTNAQETEDAIHAGIADKTGQLIINAKDLEYISSAGLRVLLRLKKAHADLKIVEVSSEVYEILEMTGFTEMMTVEKAYACLSVEGCKEIGRGANGVVYRYDPETIVKVYFNADALDDIRRERELARTAFVLGVPTAISYDVVRVGDSYGSVFELLNAKSLTQLITDDPDNIDQYIDMFVDLMKKIHATVVDPESMPDQRLVTLGWAEFLKDHLPKDQADRLYALIEAVPENNHMMHGDYHTKNVMVQNGEALLIDMDTLCHGNPIFELASVYNAFVGFGVVDHSAIRKFMDLPVDTAEYIWHRTVKLYLGTDDKKRVEEVERNAKLIGMTRLLRRTIRREADTEMGQKMIAYCKNAIAESVFAVESLAL